VSTNSGLAGPFRPASSKSSIAWLKPRRPCAPRRWFGASAPDCRRAPQMPVFQYWARITTLGLCW